MRKLLIVGLATVAMSTSALAWGDREQGALAGIVGTLIFQNATQPRYNQPVYTQPPIVYTHPQQYPGVVFPTYTHRPMYKMVDVFFYITNYSLWYTTVIYHSFN